MSITLKVARQINDDVASGIARETASAVTPIIVLQQRDIVEIRADKVEFGPKPATQPVAQVVSPQESKAGRPPVFGTADMARLPGQGGFKTDADITTAQSNGAGRTLQKFDFSGPTGGSDNLDLSAPHGRQGGTSWDQFAVNERQFGVKTDFNEEMYTTKLDRSAADYKDRERKAQKLADEILGSTAGNVHQAEERGLAVDDSGLDEEDKSVMACFAQGKKADDAFQILGCASWRWRLRSTRCPQRPHRRRSHSWSRQSRRHSASTAEVGSRSERRRASRRSQAANCEWTSRSRCTEGAEPQCHHSGRVRLYSSA